MIRRLASAVPERLRAGKPMPAARTPVPSELELDLGRYTLRRDGRQKRLERLPMELLILLAERQGQLVTRSEILERLWGTDVFVDGDAAINTAVRKVRRALGDDPDRPRFVETVVGKGYRFVGSIQIVRGPPSPPTTVAEEPVATRLAVSSSARGALGSRRWQVALAAVVLTLALAFAVALRHARAGPELESVAVLPSRTSAAIPTPNTSAKASPTTSSTACRGSLTSR